MTKIIICRDFSSENLVCDCRMKWIVPWVANTGVNIADTLCTGPSSLKDTPVKNLNRDNLNCGKCISLLLLPS